MILDAEDVFCTVYAVCIFVYLTGILLLVDDHDGILLGLPLRFRQSLLHLRPLGRNHLESLLLRLCDSFLDLVHGLTLHLVHRLFCVSGRTSVSSLAQLVSLSENRPRQQGKQLHRVTFCP